MLKKNLAYRLKTLVTTRITSE